MKTKLALSFVAAILFVCVILGGIYTFVIKDSLESEEREQGVEVVVGTPSSLSNATQLLSNAITNQPTLGDVCNQYNSQLEAGDNIYSFIQSLKNTEFDITVNPSTRDRTFTHWQGILYTTQHQSGITPDEVTGIIAPDIPALNLTLEEARALTQDQYYVLKVCGSHNAVHKGAYGNVTDGQTLEFLENQTYQTSEDQIIGTEIQTLYDKEYNELIAMIDTNTPVLD